MARKHKSNGVYLDPCAVVTGVEMGAITRPLPWTRKISPIVLPGMKAKRAPVVLPNDARNAWLYGQFCRRERGSLVLHKTIVGRLKRECDRRGWSFTDDVNALKRGATGWAKRNGKPPIPKRKSDPAK